MDDLESHSGAETMPAKRRSVYDYSLAHYAFHMLTILVQDIQALLYQQCGIEDNQAVANRQHVIARPRLEKSSDSSLGACQPLTATFLLPGRALAYQAVQLLTVNSRKLTRLFLRGQRSAGLLEQIPRCHESRSRIAAEGVGRRVCRVDAGHGSMEMLLGAAWDVSLQ